MTINSLASLATSIICNTRQVRVRKASAKVPPCKVLGPMKSSAPTTSTLVSPLGFVRASLVSSVAEKVAQAQTSGAVVLALRNAEAIQVEARSLCHRPFLRTPHTLEPEISCRMTTPNHQKHSTNLTLNNRYVSLCFGQPDDGLMQHVKGFPPFLFAIDLVDFKFYTECAS